MQILVEDCSKSYNHQKIIDHLNVTVSSGSRTAILGNNGSGKSTLSLILAGQIAPNKGSISWSIGGQNIKAEDVFSHVSLSSPALVLPEEFTIGELLNFHTRFKQVQTNLTEKSLIDLCGFDVHVKTKPIKNFSSGMKQRIKLCLAILSNSHLLILDEPTENLDAKGIDLYHQLIKDVAQERTLIVATNRESDYGMCDSFIRL